MASSEWPDGGSDVASEVSRVARPEIFETLTLSS